MINQNNLPMHFGTVTHMLGMNGTYGQASTLAMSLGNKPLQWNKMTTVYSIQPAI